MSMKKAAPRRRITLERTYPSPIEDVWDLWTTTDGIESWWGPEGFSVKVRKLDLRPGGVLEYAMTATAPAQVQFMKKAGVPLTTDVRIAFTEVVARRRRNMEQPDEWCTRGCRRNDPFDRRHHYGPGEQQPALDATDPRRARQLHQRDLVDQHQPYEYSAPILRVEHAAER